MKIGLLLTFALLASVVRPAEAQIVVTGARAVADRPPSRVAPDRGTNIRSLRRERNPYFAARPVYPPVPRGTRASINFAPFTSKYYPREDEYYPPVPTSRSTRTR